LPHRVRQGSVSALILAGMALGASAGASSGHPIPIPPLEEWQASAAEVEPANLDAGELDGDDPFPDITADLLFPRASEIPGEVLDAPVEPARDGRVARIEEHLARRVRSQLDPGRLASVILRAAEWARVDPVLVLAIIEVESGFDPAARSSRGARGLMQVVPATLKRQAEISGLPGDDPHAPELNVPAGVLYFRRLLDAFGNKYAALMAYNAGPNRIAGLIRAGGIPERFHGYPRRVLAEEERLRRALALEPPVASSAVGAAARAGLIAGAP